MGTIHSSTIAPKQQQNIPTNQQSSVEETPGPSKASKATPTDASDPKEDESVETSKSLNRAGKKKLTSYNQIEIKCRKKKLNYDRCYKTWYSGSFKKGTATDDSRDDCDELFEIYRSCYLRGVQAVRLNQGAGEPSNESALGQFLEDEEE
mmetsp:Transcript_40559/g.47456  ORF Transcript_40559/g.47456 Transcript_40559/m.47456 type:complete len:150 (-) Transcript_40559:865-1314(-)|eukprot:CAMPEP_0194372024 /NCGR_PEP_ID=MMETSP0174-20130528/20323_1 /TAXON_ID=216777 /ORGANISM="Proboscia alata, Strain PI-D3" /LENGTH=149 /DNA_ID=CAMNT_0039150289 /DNA_START=132 /DNA_END=581 /DNA_ORIENTATION=+